MSPNLIESRLAAVEERVAAACTRSGRQRPAVTLIAVSKTFPSTAVEDAIAAGATDIGENRVQEARSKRPLVAGHARWHLIGHLQSNKVKDAVRTFDVIHTIDSSALARKVANEAAAARKKCPEVLVEVNVGEEPQKSGVLPGEAMALCSELALIDGLNLVGLMAIPPLGEPEDTRHYFRALRLLRDEIRAALGIDTFRELSMGMSDDFEVAIEEGSTMVRVGRAIFGEREHQ